MSAIVATYLVRITLREPEPPEEPLDELPPTIERITSLIEGELEAATYLEANVTAERTDV